MANKLNKQERKAFAKMSAYQLLNQYDSFAFGGMDITEDEKEALVSEIKELADKILGNLPSLYTTESIYDYCFTEYKK